jgi:hypothetical protein
MKYKNTKTTKFRSKFEALCYQKLVDANIEFEYEPYAILLVEGFTTKAVS